MEGLKGGIMNAVIEDMAMVEVTKEDEDDKNK